METPIKPSVWTVPDTEENREYLSKFHRITIMDFDTSIVIARFASLDYETVNKLADDFIEKYKIREKYPKAIKLKKTPKLDFDYIHAPYIPMEDLPPIADTSLSHHFDKCMVDPKYFTFINSDNNNE